MNVMFKGVTYPKARGTKALLSIRTERGARPVGGAWRSGTCAGSIERVHERVWELIHLVRLPLGQINDLRRIKDALADFTGETL